MDKIVKDITYPTSRTYILIYSLKNEEIMTNGWIYGFYNDLEVIRDKQLPDEHIICYDKYNTYDDEQKYCIQMKTPTIDNIQVKLDFYVINHLYGYLDSIILTSKNKMKNDLNAIYFQLKNHQRDQFELMKYYVKQFNKEIYHLLYIINILLIRQKKHRICNRFWLNNISPYLFTN